MKCLLGSDCEGPISKNDNAFEITSQFIPQGQKIFTVISRYDDLLADVLKRPGYKAGNTLKLILPFFKAYDLTDRKIQDFSAQNLALIPDIKYTLLHARKIAHTFIVSTSYEHYIRALCQAIDFPYEDTYCTKVKIDNYDITEQEKDRLKELAQKISQMSIIEIPSGTESVKDLQEEDQLTIKHLDQIFWNEIRNMESGRFLQEVNPVGGSEKADAIEDAAEQVNVSLSKTIYVGDSITDVEAFKLTKDCDGLAVSFNGNQYAVRDAEIAVLSEHSIATAIIADVFCRLGKRQTLSLAENWNYEKLKRSSVSRELLDKLFRLYPEELPKVRRIDSENREALAEESSKFRKQVRGEAIGRLG